MAMTKGFAFKVLAPKDIANVLTMIGVYPAVSAETIDKPTSEQAMSVYQHLSEFAFDLETSQVKAQTVGCVQHAEIYDEALDVITVFKLAKQLAMINMVDDFNIKDIWEPGTKRFRAVLSGIINFCRYKEAKVIVITGMKEDLHSMDCTRLELIEKTGQAEQELATAQERHGSELQAMWSAENECQEAKSQVDKLTKQRQSADRVVEDAEGRGDAARGRLAQGAERTAHIREKVDRLQDQVAESPEGIEVEIQDLTTEVRKQKERLEERGAEKRGRHQRDQVLGRLLGHVESYRDDVAKLGQAAAAAATAKDRRGAADDELADLRQALEARRAEEADVEQGLRQVQAELERSKQAHEERMQQLEVRRQAALGQHKELQAKRTEEQKHNHALQAQRLELEAEVAAFRRAHGADMSELRAKQRVLFDGSEAYSMNVDALLAQGPGVDATSAKHRVPSASPDAATRKILSCSPSPARGVRGPSMSPSGYAA